MKKIRLFAIVVFILSVNIPLASSLVEPTGLMEEATSKLLVTKERNSSLNFKIAHTTKRSKRRLGRRKFSRKKLRGKRFRRNSISAKNRAIRRKFSQRRLNSRQGKSIKAKIRTIRRNFSRRIHNHG